MTTPEKNQKRQLLVVGVASAVLAVAVGAIVWTVLAPGQPPPDGASCSNQGGKTFADVDHPATLLPGEGQPVNFTWTFDDPAVLMHKSTRLYEDDDGRSSGPAIRPGAYYELNLSDLENDEHSRTIPADQIGYFATATGQYVEVTLCVRDQDLPPGVYSGALAFTDQHVHAAPIAVSITVPHGDQRIPITLFILGTVLAVILILARAWGMQERVPILGLIVAIVLAVAAALAQVGPLEIASAPKWGSKSTDFLTIVLATLAAVFGGAAIGELWADVKRNAHDEPAEEGPAGPDPGAPDDDKEPVDVGA